MTTHTHTPDPTTGAEGVLTRCIDCHVPIGMIDGSWTGLPHLDRNFTQELGEALSELAHATLFIRQEGPDLGEIHYKPNFVGTKPRISEKSMVLIREALRPANAPQEPT